MKYNLSNVSVLLGLIAFSLGAQEVSLPGVSLVIERAVGETGLKLDVELRNSSAQTVRFDSTSRQPEVVLRLFDSRGVDVLRPSIASGPNPIRHVELAAGASERYRIERESLGEDDAAPTIPAGHYKVQAAIPVITYAGGKYSVQFIESERVDVEIGHAAATTKP